MSSKFDARQEEYKAANLENKQFLEFRKSIKETIKIPNPAHKDLSRERYSVHFEEEVSDLGTEKQILFSYRLQKRMAKKNLSIHDLLKNSSKENDYKNIRKKRKEIFLIIDSYKNIYNEREKDSLIRVKNELFQSAEKLRGIKLHATPISLRNYCLIFIYLSPFLFNTQLIVEKSIFGIWFRIHNLLVYMYCGKFYFNSPVQRARLH